jgi:hypothetical protein
MAKKLSGKANGPGTLKKLAAIAVRLPDAEQGVACEGTVVESSTMKVNGKAFLFLRQSQAMLKLGKSLAEAAAIGESEPEAVRAGAGGWVKVMFEDGPPPMPRMERWIRESYGLFADLKATKTRRAAWQGEFTQRHGAG